MTAKGTVRGNVVVLEQGACLPEGTPVEVRVLTEHELRVATAVEREAALARLLSMNLPVAAWEQMEQEIMRGATECLP